jgi:hypothetical protein
MSRSKTRRDLKIRRAEKKAHERWVRTGNAEHLRKYVGLSNEAQSAQTAYERSRDDTGWKLLDTTHGPRFHRELDGRELDVEPQVATWIGSSIKDRMLEAVSLGHRTQHEAAEAIETKVGVTKRLLPALEVPR